MVEPHTKEAHPPGPPGRTGRTGPCPLGDRPPMHYPMLNAPFRVSKKEIMELLNKYESAYPQTHTQKGTDYNPVLFELDSKTYWKEIPILLDFDQRTSTLDNSGFGVRSEVCPYVDDFKQ